jgi:hypothetical protein
LKKQPVIWILSVAVTLSSAQEALKKQGQQPPVQSQKLHLWGEELKPFFGVTDFGIRKSAFLNQQAETPVMLWMVVVITLSGVLLAAIQLLAAYKLASSGKGAFEQGGQLSVEAHKISLGSSVTGLIILTVSLAFFIVFVTQVYVVKEVRFSLDGPDRHQDLLPGTAQPIQGLTALPKNLLTGAPSLPSAISQPHRVSSKRSRETVPGGAALPNASAQRD